MFIAFEAYRATNESLPYYAAPDMDLATVIDQLAIGADRLPAHLGHPGFGMYLAQAHLQSAASSIGAADVYDLDDLAMSLNPPLVSAAATRFLRWLSVLVVLWIAFSSWRAVARLSEAGPLASLAALAILLSLPSLVYHSGLIRSEIYAVGYWTAALWLASRLVSPSGERQSARSCVGWVVVGVLLGLSITTKVQGLVLALVLVPWIALAAYRSAPVGVDRPFAAPAGTMGLAIANLLGGAALWWFARATEEPLGTATFAAGYPGNAVGAAIGLLVLATTGLRAAQSKLPLWLTLWNGVAIAILFGALSSFLLHFTLYTDSATATQHLLLDFKVSFLRTLAPSVAGANPTWADLAATFGNSPALTAAHVIAFVAFCVCFRARPLLLVLAVSTEVVLLAHAGLAVRQRVRDELWFQVPIAGLTLCYAVWAIQTFPRATLARLVAAGFALALVWTNVEEGALASTRLTAGYGAYGFRPSAWTKGTYGASHLTYLQHVEARLPADEASRAAAIRQASHEESVLRRARTTFPGHALRHTDIGILAPGFPTRSSSEDAVLEVPESLRNLALVDLSDAPIVNHIELPDPIKGVPLWRERLEVAASDGDTGTTILAPRDLEVWVFSSESIRSASPGCRLEPSRESIRLERDGHAIELSAYRVRGLCTWPNGGLPTDAVFGFG